MWPLCYENINKLNISIGIGLIVATFILFLTNQSMIHESSFKLIDSQKEDIIFFQENNLSLDQKNCMQESLNDFRLLQRDYILEINENLAELSIILLFMGIIMFLLGYIPFAIKEYKLKHPK